MHFQHKFTPLFGVSHICLFTFYFSFFFFLPLLFLLGGFRELVRSSHRTPWFIIYFLPGVPYCKSIALILIIATTITHIVLTVLPSMFILFVCVTCAVLSVDLSMLFVELLPFSIWLGLLVPGVSGAAVFHVDVWPGSRSIVPSLWADRAVA